MYYFVDSGPKFTGLVWLNAEESLEITCLSDFGYLVFPEIFAIKVGICVKSTQNLAEVKI